jgi:hypothetical protein
LENGFIDHLRTPFGTTSNCSTTANLHNSQIITAPTKPFSSPLCLLTLEILQLPVLMSLLSSEYPATELERLPLEAATKLLSED